MTIIQKLHAKRSKKGFTLVELVIVIAILAILAAIAIPVVASVITSANESADKSDAATLDLACKSYYAKVEAGIKAMPSGVTDKAALKIKDAMDDAGLKITMTGKTGNGFYGVDKKIVSAKEAGTLTGLTALTADTTIQSIYGTGSIN